jgi:hypothetical protein
MPKNGKRNQKPPTSENIACGNQFAHIAQVILDVSGEIAGPAVGCPVYKM